VAGELSDRVENGDWVQASFDANPAAKLAGSVPGPVFDVSQGVPPNGEG